MIDRIIGIIIFCLVVMAMMLIVSACSVKGVPFYGDHLI